MYICILKLKDNSYVYKKKKTLGNLSRLVSHHLNVIICASGIKIPFISVSSGNTVTHIEVIRQNKFCHTSVMVIGVGSDLKFPMDFGCSLFQGDGFNLVD